MSDDYSSSIDYVEELLKSPYPIQYAQHFREEFIEDPELLERALKEAYKRERCEVFEALAIVMFNEVIDFAVDGFLVKPDLHYYLRVDPRRLLDDDDPGKLELACKQAKANNDLAPLVTALNKLARLLPPDRFEKEFAHYASVLPIYLRHSPEKIESPLLARMIGRSTCQLQDAWVDYAFAQNQEEFLTCTNPPATGPLARMLRKALVLGRWNFINYLYVQHRDAVKSAVLTFSRDMRDYIVENSDVSFDGSRIRDLLFRARHLEVPIVKDPAHATETLNFVCEHGCPELVQPMWYQSYNVMRKSLVEILRRDYHKAEKVAKMVLTVPKRYRRGLAEFFRTGVQRPAPRWGEKTAEIFEANFKT